MELSSSLTVFNEQMPFLIEKRIALLQAIESEGSISKAAKKVPMSYKSAWDAVDAMNNLASQTVVSRETGGKGGGGAFLTQYGKTLVHNYLGLQKVHSEFLEKVSKMTDFTKSDLQTIQRLSMRLSARNQISGVVEHIADGKVNSEVYIKLKSGYTIVSVITKEAVNNLDLKIADDVTAIFKSSSVLITSQSGLDISARNKFKGTITSIEVGDINAEVVLDIGGESIASVITKGAVQGLNLKEGQEACAIIKSSDVMVGV